MIKRLVLVIVVLRILTMYLLAMVASFLFYLSHLCYLSFYPPIIISCDLRTSALILFLYFSGLSFHSTDASLSKDVITQSHNHTESRQKKNKEKNNRKMRICDVKPLFSPNFFAIQTTLN